MDSMEVNKGIAAVLVAGIIFFLTGMIADNLVDQTPLEKSVLKIAGAPAAETAAPAPAELPPIAPLLAKADVGSGDKFVHTVCTACHSFNDGGKPIIGPNLYGVVGGPHDHEAGFNYSPALEKFKGQPWTFDALNHWLDNPAVYAPGTRMTFAGIPSAQQRADVIAYLRTLSPHPVPLPPPEAPKPAAAPAAAGAPGAAKAPGAATAPAGGAAATPAAPAPTGGASATPAAPAPAGGAAAPPATPAPTGGAAATPAAPAPAPPAASASPEPSPPAK
jgi:cytochrome c